MTIHHKIIVSSILILFFIFSTISAERCHPDDKKALLQIKRAFNNAGKFATLKPDTDCCEWYLIECDESTNRVRILSVTNETEVAGRIPDAVGDLPYLERVYFTSLPNLIGPIPQAIAKLKKLKSLTIVDTNITGPIPGVLSKLTNLDEINLAYNKITGSIPASLANLPILQGLSLEHNLLTGPIPDTFSRFKNNPYFYLNLAENQLSGPIPKSLGEAKFMGLDISRNSLTGDASVFFGKNKGLLWVDLSRNKFTFDMTKVAFPNGLGTLDLSHNKIYGSLPKSLTEIPGLMTFNVSCNQLCGQIPKGGALYLFDKSSYVQNKCLCGAPLAPCKKLGNNI
ncbi:polygalacturonase inhibitor 1-like [Silene latifolia]|uniref:polygalacturonase inhibitor 1-like n=1 Tax=Silene latifolia TaxID=37657 RepID=UPI003D783BB0